MLPTRPVPGLAVDPDALDVITSTLTAQADAVTECGPTPVEATWFGSSYTGGHVLALHASLARDTLVESLQSMSKGLEGHAETLLEHSRRAGDIDEASADFHRALARNAAYVTDGEGTEQR